MNENSGAGGWSIKGFEYQVNVSVWLALDLMVGAKLARQMTLEAASEEDIEADIEEFQPASVARSIPMSGYHLIVQAKRRSGDAWTETQFLKLLGHGKARKSAKLRLEEEPEARYLLVTSTGLNGAIRKIGVRRAGAWPAAENVPDKITAAVKGIAGRVAVVGSEDDERLVTDIKTLLVDRFRVPSAQWESCLNALRAGAWDRMRGAADGRWTVEDVQTELLKHHGYLTKAPELESYVKPNNWDDLREAILANSAVLIIGQSGSGKTTTADALWEDLRQEIPGLQRVHITHGPTQLRGDKTVPPVLYDIEDPWGRFRFEPESRPWNDQLSAAFGSARHDRLFVATSRTDVAKASGAIDHVKRWCVRLDVEHYGKRERRMLYKNLGSSLPRHLRTFAHEHAFTALRQLELPLEIRKFFDALAELTPKELTVNSRAEALRRAIDQAHRDSIEFTVIQQIEATHAVKAAVILWGLIKPHGRLSISVLRSIEDALADADPELEDTVEALINRFIGARNLRQGEDGSIAYYHPKVEAGIEEVISRNPQASKRTLLKLIRILVSRDVDTRNKWGKETAAKTLRSSKRLGRASPTIDGQVQWAIDSWLVEHLRSFGNDLEDRLDLAASVGSKECNLAEMARWLAYRSGQDLIGLTRWHKPERGAAWFARLRRDSQVRDLFKEFVRTILPSDQTTYSDTFAEDAEPFVGDTTDAYIAAAKAAVTFGYCPNAELIADAASANLESFEPIVDAAVEFLRPTEAKLATAHRDRLMMINAEVPKDYDELYDLDEGYTALCFLDTFVSKSRLQRGWESIVKHRHFDSLRSRWLRLLLEEQLVGREELYGALEHSYQTENEEALWQLLTRHWDPRALNRLTSRLAGGHDVTELRISALECLTEHVPDRLADIVASLDAAADRARLAELACDLAEVEFRHEEARLGAIGVMKEMLPETFRELSMAMASITRNELAKMSERALQDLATIDDAPETVRAARAAISRHLDIESTNDIQWILANSEDHTRAVIAIEDAIQSGMDNELKSALEHRFAHVAARALTSIADPLAAPLPKFLLDLAERDSSPVRRALLDQISEKPHEDHLKVLLLLISDEWQEFLPRGPNDFRYPIARDAAKAIAALPEVPGEVLDELFARVEMTDDVELIHLLLGCVVRHGNPNQQMSVVGMTLRGRKVAVGRAAASALFCRHQYIKNEVIGRIPPKAVVGLPASIAGFLVATIGAGGSSQQVKSVCDALVECDDRKVFLALLALAVRDIDPAKSDSIAGMLPDGNSLRLWAKGLVAQVDDADLADLGDASAVDAMKYFMG